MQVVYTAITKGKDFLVQGQERTGATFIAWLDRETNPGYLAEWGDWYVKQIHAVGKINKDDYVRQAKFYKILPHLCLPKGTKYSLWIDGDCRLKVPVQVLIDKYLKDADIAFFQHPLRDCIYDEAQVCRELVLDDVFKMDGQMAKYEREGFPRHFGLIDGSVILRRHSPEVALINETWWKEIVKYSRRDQLSFNYVHWKMGFKYNLIDGFNHVGTNEYVERLGHLREGHQ